MRMQTQISCVRWVDRVAERGSVLSYTHVHRDPHGVRVVHTLSA